MIFDWVSLWDVSNGTCRQDVQTVSPSPTAATYQHNAHMPLNNQNM